MLSKILTVLLLLSTVFVNTSAQYAFATDVTGILSVSQFKCIKSNGYSAIFTQIYSALSGGSVDTTGSQNVIYAHQVGLGTEVYINPAPQSSKPSYTQCEESYNLLKNANINVRTIWLKVTNPALWSSNPSQNINFIQGILTCTRNYGINLGIYTNWYDWYQITASSTAFQQYNLRLWYWDVYGFGSSAEGTKDFSDFRPFGNWIYSSVKQYALTEWFCSAVISKVVYLKSNNILEFTNIKNLTQPVAGSAIL
uniref:Lysozyme n=1 Tax=Strongyloides venezuelensis TaxID=75913 RepID=A0A0K0EZ61_STRVS